LKGIEGLPLKYIALIVVAALIIGVVFGIVNLFAGVAIEGAETTTSGLETGINEYNLANCRTFNSTGNLVWNTTSNICCNNDEWIAGACS